MSLLNPKSVYLCGTMSNQKNCGVEWRKKVQRWLEARGQLVFNPCNYESKLLKKYNVKAQLYRWDSLPQQMQEEIVERDLQQIEKHTSFVICYYTKASSGTTKEMVCAWRNKIPLYIVTKRRIRGWEGTAARSGTSKSFKDWLDLYNHISYKYKLKRRKLNKASHESKN